METSKKDNLPTILVGGNPFEEFVEDNTVFVDKTRIISTLINDPQRAFFLSRPRRFGKTLLLDTIKNIFEGEKHLFENLDIGKSEFDRAWEPFPVIMFSFNGYPHDPVLLKKRLIYELNKIVAQHKLPIRTVND
ncbi:MAG: AAA family ATPase, partial [Deltaproteobacteria bacterium]|nr:AAA family ATPase [Deltaproteobacteria bacterium]